MKVLICCLSAVLLLLAVPAFAHYYENPRDFSTELKVSILFQMLHLFRSEINVFLQVNTTRHTEGEVQKLTNEKSRLGSCRCRT
jgi:hypothetical protein